jgi:NTE family protein
MRISRQRGCVLFLTVALLFYGCGLAGAEGAGGRPKIALVLGGGGAKGAAHVGVLKVLEECRVPIDFVIGTSMGSIVGGLYASGLSPADMYSIMSETDWVDLFSDKPSEEYLPFRLKKEDTRLMRFELGITKKGIAFPRGAIGGQKLEFMLKQLTLSVADTEDFDKLRLPFRAVATDLSTGEVVVIKHGSLPKAMRASMSIPGVFPPAELDGRILVDGYVVNNVPVEAAKEMGADIIIVVDVGGKLGKANVDMSLLEIMAQSSDILARQNVERSLALLTEKDLLISPDLKDIKPDSFTRTPEAVDIGEAAARAVIDKIKRYSVTESEYQAFLAQQRARPMRERTVEFIDVTPPARVTEERVRGQLKTRVGEPLDTVRLQDDLTRVYALGDFETVDFKLVQKDGKDGLQIDTKEKKWGPNYLRLGLNFSSDSQGDSNYALLTEFRMTQLTKLGAEWRTIMELGSDQQVYSEFYAPLDTKNFFFVDPYFRGRRLFKDSFSGDTRIAEYEVNELGGGVDFGINFSSLAEGRFGIVQRVIDAKVSTGNDPSLPEYEDRRNAGFRGRLVYDQLDNHTFPKNGILSQVDFFGASDALGSEDTYEKIEFNFSKARTYGGKHTVIGSLIGGTVLGEDAPYFDDLKLGGFFHLSGYADDQLRGQHKGLARLIYYYKLGSFGPSAVLRNGVYVGASFEAGNVWREASDISIDDLLLGGTVFLGFDSFFGPIYLGYGKTEGSEDGKFYICLGKTF